MAEPMDPCPLCGKEMHYGLWAHFHDHGYHHVDGLRGAFEMPCLCGKLFPLEGSERAEHFRQNWRECLIKYFLQWG
jgi:hypothetical protein